MANELLNTKNKRTGTRGTFPVPKDFSPEGKRFAQHIIDNIQQITGEKGNPLDKAVTFNDLINAGIAKRNFVLTSGGSAAAGFVGGDDTADTPSIPTNVSAAGAFQNIVINWDRPTYSGHSHTEIWVANTDSFATKVFLAQTNATVFSHQVGNGATKYYWVRHVNVNNVAGSFHDDNGVFDSTAVDVGALMAELSEEIKLLPGFSTLNTDMNITIGGVQRTLQSTLETINTLADSAQTSVNSLTTNTPRVIRSDNEPSTREDGTSLQAGDVWIDTDSSPNINELFVYTGSAFAATTAGSTSSSDTTLQTQITSNGNAISQNASNILLVAGVSDAADISTSINITSLNNSITNPTTGLSALASSISTLSNTVTTQGSSITTNSTNITELQNTVTGFDGSNTISSAISGLQTSINTNGSNISSLSSGVTALDNEVDLKARTFIQPNAPTATAIGDLWIDSDDNNKLYRATATTNSNWVAVGDTSGLHIFAQDDEPTARPDGSSLQEGDLWFDTNDNRRQYRYNGTAFVPVDDSRISANSSAISTLDSEVTALDGVVTSNSSKITALENTVNDSASGVAATASALSSLTNTVTAIPVNFRQANEPTTGLTQGDLWIDTDDNQLYRYDTTNGWESVRDSVITSNSQAITALQNTVDDETTGVSANATAITSLETEVYGSGGASASRIDGLEATVNNSTTGVAANASAISALTTVVDTKNKTFVNPNPPADNAENDLRAGDLWIDSNDNNKLYRFGTGGSWIPLTPSSNQTFIGSSAPTANSIGDIWIDTGDNNQIKRWNGTEWQALRDGLITANASSITAIQSEIGQVFDARITTVSGSKNLDVQTMSDGSPVEHGVQLADINTGVFLSLKDFVQTGGLSIEQINRTFKVSSLISNSVLRVEIVGSSASSSTTGSVVSDSCTIGTNAGVLQLAETTTNTLGQSEASYVLQVNSNGHIAGFAVQSSTDPSGQQSSDVIFQADRFSIVPSSGTGSVAPFIVNNGVVHLDTARIQDASIASAKIGSLAVDKLSGSFATFANTVTGDLDVTNLTGTFANFESVITGTLSADSISIDNVTLDTDGNGNLIIKSGGVTVGELATKAAGAFATFTRGAVTVGSASEGGSYVEVISFGTSGGGGEPSFVAGEAGRYSAFYSANLADPDENITGDDGADILMQVFSNTNSSFAASKTMRLYANRGMGFTVATTFNAAANESFQIRVFVRENNGLTENAFVDNNFLQVMRITKGQ